jgi:hypothetical protein
MTAGAFSLVALEVLGRDLVEELLELVHDLTVSVIEA